MSRLVSRAENWETIYDAVQNVNFAAFDFNSIKQSIIDYIKLYHSESFNDFIETSELIAIIETFAYVAELLAYRIDVTAQENFLSTAQRRDSVLRLAKMVSYTASRPIPARGMVKITSVKTSEPLYDTLGNSLANVRIRWNDSSNTAWKDQFLLVMNRVLDQTFGTVAPSDRFQLQNTLFEIYGINNIPLQNGVFPYTARTNNKAVQMELVPVAYDADRGIIERRPYNNSKFNILYGQDGLGDASSSTGFFCLTKQGKLSKQTTSFDGTTPFQTFDVQINNINDTDIWINNINTVTGDTVDLNGLSTIHRSSGLKTGEWEPVDISHSQNIVFNSIERRTKYEVETTTNNRVRVIFGDGEFADIPSGTFDVWARASLDENVIIPQTAVVDQTASFTYVDYLGRTQTFTFTYTLTGSLQNASAAEDIERIKTTAPSVYYTQNRMVNAQDYNKYLLQDPTVLKLRTVNRTFAGDSKYLTWNDPSGVYQDVKVFSNDGILFYKTVPVSDKTPVVTANTLIITHLEPLLSSTDVMVNVLSQGGIAAEYRRVFSDVEIGRITDALTTPPIPARIKLFYNKFTSEWYACKYEEDPANVLSSTTLGISGWETGAFIEMPVFFINQTAASEESYTITRMAVRLMFRSGSTTFWNTNTVDRVVDYDTLTGEQDEVVLLQANINANNDGVLKQDWKFHVVGQDVIQDGTDVGLTDNSTLSILPVDEAGIGYPQGLDPTDYENGIGLADVFNPKFILDTSSFNYPLPATGKVVTLPIHYRVSPTIISDITIYSTDPKVPFPLQIGVHWTEDPTSTISNKILIYDVGRNSEGELNTSLRICVREFVYMARNTVNEPFAYVEPTVENMNEFALSELNQNGLWTRYPGTSHLNFMWLHRSPDFHLIDPAASNINDMFVITRGYHEQMKQWLTGQIATIYHPTSLDLRTTYEYLISSKMISDTVVVHPGRFKILFGPKADPSLRGIFNVVRTPYTQLTDSQIKSVVVTTIRNFFDVVSWEFGETFYFTELATAVHAALPNDISSITLIPSATQLTIDSFLQILCKEDEIFIADINAEQIMVTTSVVIRPLTVLNSGVTLGTNSFLVDQVVDNCATSRYCMPEYCDNQYLITLLRCPGTSSGTTCTQDWYWEPSFSDYSYTKNIFECPPGDAQEIGTDCSLDWYWETSYSSLSYTQNIETCPPECTQFWYWDPVYGPGEYADTIFYCLP